MPRPGVPEPAPQGAGGASASPICDEQIGIDTASGKDADGGTDTREGKFCFLGMHDPEETQYLAEPTAALYAAVAVAQGDEASPEACARTDRCATQRGGCEASDREAESCVAWMGQLLSDGNADRKFNQLDTYVYGRLVHWMVRRAGQRKGRVERWSHDRFVEMACTDCAEP